MHWHHYSSGSISENHSSHKSPLERGGLPQQAGVCSCAVPQQLSLPILSVVHTPGYGEYKLAEPCPSHEGIDFVERYAAGLGVGVICLAIKPVLSNSDNYSTALRIPLQRKLHELQQRLLRRAVGEGVDGLARTFAILGGSLLGIV